MLHIIYGGISHIDFVKKNLENDFLCRPILPIGDIYCLLGIRIFFKLFFLKNNMKKTFSLNYTKN